MKRSLLFILLTAICFLSVSCGQVESNGLDDFQSLIDGTGDLSDQPEEPFAQMVYVVIPKNASSQLSEKANGLASAITDKTGVTAAMKYDNESIVTSDKNLEILVGNTSRLRSKEILKNFRVGEYVCRWDRGSIIIGGRDEAATIAAIDDFSSTVLHGSSSTSLMGDDVKLEKRLEYDIESITLNGYDLCDFTIVYSEQNENGEEEIAYTLREYIARKSGYLLDIMPYSSRGADTGKVICVGDALVDNSEKQSHKAILSAKGADVSIYGSGSYELSASVAEFADKILAVGQDKRVAAQIKEYPLDNAAIASIKLCSAFFDGTCGVDRIASLSDKIRLGEYDIISFFPMSSADANDVEENKNSYEYYEIELGADEVFPVLYRAAAIKNVSFEVSGDLISVVFTSAVGDNRYSFSYSANDSALSDVDGYRISVIDSKKTETAGKTVAGLDLIGSKSFEWQDYAKSIYVDPLLLVGEGVVCEKTEQSGWSMMFCSVDVRIKYCDAFIRLKDAS